MVDVPGVTHCFDCQSELEPIGTDGDPPVKRVDLQCPSCSEAFEIRMMMFPGGSYVALATVDREQGCSGCSNEADAVVLDNRNPLPEYYCRECLRPHHERTLFEEL